MTLSNCFKTQRLERRIRSGRHAKRKAPLLLIAVLILPTPVIAGDWLGAGLTLSAATPAPAPLNATQAIRANDFLNTLGAGTHDIQGADTPQSIINGFEYTGIRNGRDDATHNLTSASGGASVQDLCNIHLATISANANPSGVMYDELPIVDAGSAGNTNDANIADTKAEYEYLAQCPGNSIGGGAMLEAEGPNEPNNFNFYYEGTLCSASGSFLACAQYQEALYAMVKGDPILANYSVAGISEVGAEPDNQGLQFLTIPSGAGTIQPAGTVFADIANAHNYVEGNGSAGQVLIDNHARDAESVARSGPDAGDWDVYGEYWGNTWNKGFAGASTGQDDRPKVTTETGWNISNGSITADQQGRLITDLYLDASQLGWQKTFVYQMFNDSVSSGYGMFNQNGHEADAGNATDLGAYVHTLTSILQDNSSGFTPATINLSVSNLPVTGYDQLMEKSNGKYELVIWGEAFASETSTSVTVNLGSAYPTINVYDITDGTSPVHTYSNASSVSLNLTDHAMIVEF
jgi:hypothetical protein